MQLLCLLGSPHREGNSATVAAHLVAHARTLGAETETIFLNELSYRGCQGCYACKRSSDTCVITDDLTPVLGKVRNAEVLVLATAVHYGDVTAQLKSFIDRTFCFLVPDYPLTDDKSRLGHGRSFGLIQVQGHPDDTLFADIFPRYSFFFRWLGYDRCQELVRWCGVSLRDDAAARDELFRVAERAAESLLFEQRKPEEGTPTRMLRLAPLSRAGGEVVLAVVGWVVGRDVAVLEQEISRELARARRLVLDLGRTRSIDATGLDVLQRWSDRGLVLRGGSSFVRELLQRHGIEVASSGPNEGQTAQQ